MTYRNSNRMNWGTPMGAGDITSPMQSTFPMLDFLNEDQYGGATNVMPGSMGDGGGWFGKMFDKTDSMGNKTQGWGMPAIQGASALMSGILGYKQMKNQKAALAQTKKEFDMNWGAQQKTTNSAMEDRQRARVASNPNAYVSVGEYMKKNGI